MQSHKGSILEAIANNVISFTIGWLTNFYVLPMFGFHVNMSQTTWLTVIFTVISFIRQYLLRRLFNGWKI